VNQFDWAELECALNYWGDYWQDKSTDATGQMNHVEATSFAGRASAYKNLAEHIRSFGSLERFVNSARNEASK
jgi:hypothetical protein